MTARDLQLEALRQEWTRLVANTATIRGHEQDAQVAAWQPLFAEMHAEQHELKQRGEWRAGPRDLLSIVGQSRRETFHSAILAWLMTPTGHHGFGPMFLRGAMAETEPPTEVSCSDASQAETACEVSRMRSRADIVVTYPDHVIVFEVKVYANEGHQQCKRLFEDWTHETNRVFVFLTPAGRAPVTASGSSATAFRTLSFRAVSAVLERLVAEQHRADPKPWGLAAAEDYLATLKKEFP